MRYALNSILGVLLLFAAPVHAQTVPDLNPALDAFVAAMNNHDYTLMWPYVSGEYRFEGVPEGFNATVFRQLAEQFPRRIESYRVESTSFYGKGIKAHVKVVYSDSIRDEEFVFDQQGRFTSIGLFGVRTTSLETAGQDSGQPAVMRVKIMTRGGLMITGGTLNGRSGKWLIDTGSPRMILNARTEHPDNEIMVGARGISGDVGNIGIMHVDSLRWGSWKMKNLDVVAIDLSHLQEAIGDTLLGLIGQSDLNESRIRLDYAAGEMTVRRLDRLGNPVEPYEESKPRDRIRFEMQSHIPVFKAKIGGRKYLLGLDTGAETNLLDEALRERIGDAFVSVSRDTLLGAGQDQLEVVRGTIDRVTLHRTRLDRMDTVFSDLSELNDGYGLRIDGLIGYPFLSRQPVTIDFRRWELWIN